MRSRWWRRWAVRAVHGAWEWVRRRGTLTAEHPGRYRFAHFGRGAVIAFPPGTVFGESAISIGDGTLIGEWVTLTAGLVPGQDLLGLVVLRIGKGSSIGRGSMVIAHESLEIGDDVFIAPNCYLTDQNHSYTDLDVPVGRQMPDNAPVVIGDGCWIGTRAVILPGARLGRNVTVAAGSVVGGEFPDYCVIGGTPARILRRHDPERGWVAVPGPDRPTSTEGQRSTEDRPTSTEDEPTAARTG
jgi:acetyltransferase-like isoleucine patch superfamily enzyme